MKTKLFTLLFLLCGVFSQTYSTIYYVRTTGMDSNNGLDPETAFLTLDRVFEIAFEENDVIDIDGVYTLPAAKNIIKTITIQGKSPASTVLKGTTDSIHNCFVIGGGENFPSVKIQNISIEEFDFFHELRGNQGGAIRLNKGSLICNNVHFKNNRAYAGGAIDVYDGYAELNNCYFYKNKTKSRQGLTSANGGAVNMSVGSASVSDVTLIVNGCLFEANESESFGAAMRCATAAGAAGKIKILIQNSTFTANVSKNVNTSGDGGTIFIDYRGIVGNGDIQVINNTIAYNSSERTTSYARAGLYVGGDASVGTVVLKNNIMFSNISNEPAPTGPRSISFSLTTNAVLKEARNNIKDNGSALTRTQVATNSSGNYEPTANDLLQLSPTLADNGGLTKTFATSATSLAINNGYADGAPTVDQRGVARVALPDIGAYEYSNASGLKAEKINLITYYQSDKTTLFVNVQEFEKINVFTVDGKLIKTDNIVSDEYELKIKSGLYIVRFESKKVINEIIKISIQ